MCTHWSMLVYMRVYVYICVCVCVSVCMCVVCLLCARGRGLVDLRKIKHVLCTLTFYVKCGMVW